MITWLGPPLLPLGALALCTSEAAYLAACKRLKVDRAHPWLEPGSHGMTHHLEGVGEDGMERAIFVCLDLPDGLDPVEIGGILVHEAVHVWQAVCRGIHEEQAGEEIEAYAIQSIAQCLAYELRKREGGSAWTTSQQEGE